MDSNKKAQINELLSGDDTVASLPDLYYEFRDVVDDPESTFEEIGNVIIKDPGLSARVLRVVNSAFFGFSSKIETVSNAINIIGLTQLSDLVLSTLIIDKFRGIPVQLISMRSFWEHSIVTAIAAKHLAAALNESNLERFFLAGLLHDIGRPLLCVKTPDPMKEAVLISVSQTLDIHKAENQVLGFNHCEAGSVLLEKWKLPEVYCEAARFHHEPLLAKTFVKETCLVHIADVIVSRTVHACNGEHVMAPLNEEALELMGLKTGEVESGLLKVLSEKKDGVLQSLLQTA